MIRRKQGDHHVTMRADWSDTAVRQGMPRIATTTRSYEEARKNYKEEEAKNTMQSLEGSMALSITDPGLLAFRTMRQ